MKCLFSHKFILLGGEIICEKCGINRIETQPTIKKDFLGRPKKVEIIKLEQDIEEMLKK